MKTNVELCRNDTDKEKPKYLERTYSPMKNLNDDVRNDKLLFDFTQYITSFKSPTFSWTRGSRVNEKDEGSAVFMATDRLKL
jgi:hypothetical protein